jgi:hypothetical protein
MKNMTSLQVFKTTMKYLLERGRECRYVNGLGILKPDGKRCEIKNRNMVVERFLKITEFLTAFSPETFLLVPRLLSY